MLGLGKWKFTLDMFLFKGDLFLTIEERDGKYVFTPEAPGFSGKLEYSLLEATEEGNNLHIVAASTMLPGNKKISAVLTFNGDTCSAKLELPYVGRIELDNGVRVG